MGLKRTILSFKSCFRDLHEAFPFPGPFLFHETLPEGVLDLGQGKPEHGRGTPEDAWNVVLPLYAAHRDTFDELVGGEAFGGMKGRATLESFVWLLSERAA